MRAIAVTVLLVAGTQCAVGCGDEPDVVGSHVDLIELDPPVIVTGRLEITVEEGPVGDDGLSEVNFGTVETERGTVLVEVWADTARAAGIDRDELVVPDTYEVTIEQVGAFPTDDIASYRVADLEPTGE